MSPGQSLSQPLCNSVVLHPPDAFRAATVLADAFAQDPIWRKVFAGVTHHERRFHAFFEVTVRLCLRYGEVYATSDALEGIAGWVPARHADITYWKILASGALACGLRVGPTIIRRLRPLEKTLPPDRKVHMRGREYLYLQFLGVAAAHQGKGYGSALLRQLMEQCDRDDLWLYLETETEGNVRFYERHGFRMLKQVMLPELDLPMWEMARGPHQPKF